MPRSPLVIDTSKFTGVMADALAAFGTDLSYATDMCAKARVIEAKRATWNARTRLREAAADARTLCEDGPEFTCESALPCGVGPACRYATGDDLATFEPVPVKLGPTHGGSVVERPQLGPDGSPTTYNIECVVGPFRDHLAGESEDRVARVST